MINRIKKPQTTKAGYDYQNLYGAKLLIDWYHNPNKYEWVELECYETEAGSTKGLDDIVAQRQEGTYELYQVKFTVDEEKHFLTFGWLLKIEKGKSLLQKWVDTVIYYYKQGKLASAELITNRTPQGLFSSCLVENKIDVKKIDESIKAKLVQQLGSLENVEMFFDNVTFKHSYDGIDDLETRLYDQMVFAFKSEGNFYKFLRFVSSWARDKKRPAPDGKIKINHINNIFETNVSKAIPQEFPIGEQYVMPSKGFHEKFLKRIHSKQAWILYGAPGAGKSTYLSYLYKTLIEQGIPTIRHHYYVQPYDSVDRIEFHNIDYSLRHQLKELFPNLVGNNSESENLKDCLGRCASLSEKPLVLIIDGLDHVYRCEKRTKPLQHLINHLLPLPKNITLILGTQRMDNACFPTKILSAIPEENWIKLPYMELTAIKAWLENIKESGKWLVDDEFELARVADAFSQLSKGYPLYMKYSLELLLNKDHAFRHYDVEKLNPCLDGDIDAYYRSLWEGLDSLARNILHLLAIADFRWPDKKSILTCLKINDLIFYKAFSSIVHLIDEKQLSGLVPFHSSLVLHIQNHREHQELTQSLRPKILAWLRTDAPDFLKWGWEWLIEEKMGNPMPLIEGVNRQWVIDSLCKGYPCSQIQHIVDVAEERASVKECSLAKSVELQLLKARIVDGPKFQTNKLSLLIKTAVQLSGDIHTFLWYVDNLRAYDDEIILAIAELSIEEKFREKSREIILKCERVLRERMKFYSSLQNEGNRVFSIAECLIAIAVLQPSVPTKDIIAFINGFEEAERATLYYGYIVKLLSHNKGNDLFQIPLEEKDSEAMYDIVNAMIRYCCLEKITLVARPEYERVKKYPLGLVYSKLFSSEEITNINFENFEPIAKFNIYPEHWHNYFFMTLFNFLCDEKSEIIMFSIGDSVVLPSIIRGLREYAQQLADEFKSNAKINPLEIYSVFKRLNMRDNMSYSYEQSLFNPIMQAIALISVDVFLLSTAKDVSLELTLDHYNLAKQNNLWNDRIWWNLFRQWALPLIAPEMLKKGLLSLIESNEKKKIVNLADDGINYAQIVLKLGFNELAQRSMEQAVKVILGYGWRKDLTVYGVLYAIESCAKHCVGPIKQWLERTALFTTQISGYTDNDEERHAPRDLIKLIGQYYPERLVDEFQYYMKCSGWFKRELADVVIAEFLKICDFSSEINQALARCISSSLTMEVLKNRSFESNIIERLYQEQLQLLGGHPVDPDVRSPGQVYLKKQKTLLWKISCLSN